MIDKHLRFITLDPDQTQFGNIYIKYNTIQAQDSYYQFNEPDKYHFYDLDLSLISMQQLKSVSGSLYSDAFYISPFQTDYTRKVSSIFDILGYIEIEYYEEIKGVETKQGSSFSIPKNCISQFINVLEQMRND